MTLQTERALQIAGKRSRRILLAEHVTLGFLLSAALTLFIAQGYCVSGACMEPHLYTGERILAYKMAYATQVPRRGDIIIFEFPRNPRLTFVKRVIGLPGETVSMQAGQVFVDARPLTEPYRIFAAHGDLAPQLVPHDQYFVMGDNRDVSDDSRDWGDLPRSKIVGRAVACYWPPSQCQVLR